MTTVEFLELHQRFFLFFSNLDQNWPATTTLRAKVSVPPRWHMNLPLSDALTEGRHRVSPPFITLISPQSLPPLPTSSLFHFHWGLHRTPLVTLTPPSVSISSFSQSVLSSAVLLLLVGRTMRGDVLFTVFFRVSAEVACWCSSFAVLRMDGFWPVVEAVLLWVTVGTLAVEVLLLLACGPVLVRMTFSPFTFTRPLQVRTSLLPGDKTSTPGGGSSQKNKH